MLSGVARRMKFEIEMPAKRKMSSHGQHEAFVACRKKVVLQ
jgi:hypothetical protein